MKFRIYRIFLFVGILSLFALTASKCGESVTESEMTPTPAAFVVIGEEDPAKVCTPYEGYEAKVVDGMCVYTADDGTTFQAPKLGPAATPTIALSPIPEATFTETPTPIPSPLPEMPSVIEEFFGDPIFPVEVIADVPGGTRDEPKQDKMPEAWVASDDSNPDAWGVPYVLEGPLPQDAGEGVNYREHHAFEIAPGASYSAEWIYSSFAYENSDLGEKITHDTWLQQIHIWGSDPNKGRTLYSGLAIWGPDGATVTITYHLAGGDQTCTGQSAEFVPQVPFDIELLNPDDAETSAIFGIGPWDEEKTTLVGIHPPDCRPIK